MPRAPGRARVPRSHAKKMRKHSKTRSLLAARLQKDEEEEDIDKLLAQVDQEIDYQPGEIFFFLQYERYEVEGQGMTGRYTVHHRVYMYIIVKLITSEKSKAVNAICGCSC